MHSTDNRQQFRPHGEVLLLAWHGAEASGGYRRRRKGNHRSDEAYEQKLRFCSYERWNWTYVCLPHQAPTQLTYLMRLQTRRHHLPVNSEGIRSEIETTRQSIRKDEENIKTT